MKFVSLCKKSQKDLKGYLYNTLKKRGYNPVKEDGFVFAEGTNVPVLLTAHLDTVHKEKVKDVWYGSDTITSPQGIGGDDRCGIFIIMKILEKTELRPTILFCEDEEIGGIGSDKFTKTRYINKLKALKMLIELDRCGSNDAVFYECDNPDFTDWITETSRYREDWGSFSDICNLSPACGVASVNLSCGYYKAHTTKEFVKVTEMYDTMNTVIKIMEKAQLEETPFFEFIEAKYNYGYSWDTTWSPLTRQYYNTNKKSQITYFVWFDHETNQEVEDYVEADSMYEALGKFFMTYPNVKYNDILDYYYDYTI